MLAEAQPDPLKKPSCIITISIGYVLPSAPWIVAPIWGTTCSIAFHIFSLAFSFIESTFIAFALLAFGLALGFSYPPWQGFHELVEKISEIDRVFQQRQRCSYQNQNREEDKGSSIVKRDPLGNDDLSIARVSTIAAVGPSLVLPSASESILGQADKRIGMVAIAAIAASRLEMMPPILAPEVYFTLDCQHLTYALAVSLDAASLSDPAHRIRPVTPPFCALLHDPRCSY
ncbi:hypothetical protein AK812_SmicGene6089 [Symbiodinium microadriaticum]|uniref:Uncharacterized protein n=1 Tax=Symbiodinium microadriaticum TaxID=2951 RepID=A0A1Q9ERZ0_SYMMI|nr:hypothetical protein AK812_SmicGene6089 [Symbiodinium microadriaticum]